MYRVSLTEEQQQELHQRAQQKNVALRNRQRLEMIRLSAKGWSIPKIAAHLEQHEQTVRYWVKRFLEGGFDALTDKPHTGKQSAVTAEMLAAVRAWLTAGEQTWNARQVAAEVNVRYGVLRSLDQWRRLLRRERMTYKRTRRSLQHKQNPAQVAAKTEELDGLKRGPIAGN
jgi:transposase